MLTLADTAEAERWLEEAAGTDCDESDVLANLQIFRGVLLRLVGDLPGAAEAARRGIELSEPASNTYVPAVGGLGPVLYWLGEIEEARRLLVVAVPRLEAPRAVLPLVTDLGHLALTEVALGDGALAAEHASSAVALAAHYGFGDHFAVSAASLALAQLAAADGRPNETERQLRRAERQARQVGEPAVLIAVLAERAAHARISGNEGDAVACETEASLIAAIGRDPISLQRVLERFAPSCRVADPLLRSPDELTDREISVLGLLRSPLSQRDIGRELGISLNTMKTHVRSIYRKLGVNSRAAAVAVARSPEREIG